VTAITGVETSIRFAPDSLVEEAGFELSVPPERKAALDRVRRPSVTRRQALPHRATRSGSVAKRTAERRLILILLRVVPRLRSVSVERSLAYLPRRARLFRSPFRVGRRSNSSRCQIAGVAPSPSTVWRRASRRALRCGPPACAWKWRRRHGWGEPPYTQRQFLAASCRLPRQGPDR
jgi:hypothetical protein